MENEDELRVVHALRLKSLGEVALIAEVAGLPVDRVEATLARLASEGHVRFRDGALRGWLLNPSGRTHGEQLLAAQLDQLDARESLQSIYQRFLELNQPFLQLCTSWQVRTIDGEQRPNDHADATYDAGVIARLVQTDAAIQPVCRDLADLLDRFAHYGPRFAAALGNVRAGDTAWITKPMIDSYHTVWFELHEDLLASLGIDRAMEVHA